uniref:ATP synthase CF1 delta subunit n=1 Tax=Chroomonas placoidea TaxID=173977 RepID=A0A222AI83_9CRYP|nr:ATP synthase CF1 delta subunit [Chroomonas placoidea]ASO76073.1 ATP synthase CF1 delta subunit [Chroomonas placoidea]
MTSRNIKLALPYAEALLDITTKEGSLDKVINDLTSLSTTLSDSSDLKKALANPTLSSVTKKEIIKSVFKDTVSNTMIKFLMVLADRGRIAYLADVIEIALELAYKKASIQIAYVSSSLELTSSQEEALIERLQKMTGASQIKLKLSVDNSLLGGFIVQVGSKIIDNSVKGQLRQLSAYLGASVV